MVSNQSNSSNIHIGSMSTLNSIQNSQSINISTDSKKTQQLTLPEENFSGRRQSPVEIYFETSNPIDVDNCFGFDDDDELLNEECAIGNVSDKPKGIEKPIVQPIGLKNIRERLKRFLHSNDSGPTASKQSKPSNKSARIANKHKNVKSPAKHNPETIFIDQNAKKQKDIRSALTAQANEKEKSNKSNENNPAPLFEEVEIVKVQHGRKSYSGPVRQYRKRNVSIDSEPEEISDDDGEDLDENGKKHKVKRRKKAVVDPGPKVNRQSTVFNIFEIIINSNLLF